MSIKLLYSHQNSRLTQACLSLQPRECYRTRAITTLSPRATGVSPLSPVEFLPRLQSCRPKESWPDRIGVAFSGGPDSTALLYLLKQACFESGSSQELPRHVTALTVDHGLQAASSHMTEQCSELAASLQVRHMKIKIPWNIPPFPNLPEKGAAFEKVAREARYHVLLDVMGKENISIVAFGHHADDQVETALLRLSRGSSDLGAAGMRPCRRWGMGFGGGPNSLGWAGYRGMDKWIIRPLLSFPKERLVETCIANGLNYVRDPTNFQPQLTPRNFIRHTLESVNDNKTAPVSQAFREEMDALLRMASCSVDRLPGSVVPELLNTPVGTSPEQLRSMVSVLSNRTMHIEHKVDGALKNVLKASPISTALISEDDLKVVSEYTVRLGIVRRILRYVSPFPWGSPRAEASGRSASLGRIVTTLCEEKMGGKAQKNLRTKFVAGAAVVWTPVVFTPDGHIKQKVTLSSGEKRGWMASRQPPFRTPDQADSGSLLAGIADAAKPLELDVTPLLTSHLLASTRDPLEVLYDCRFLIRINFHKLPPFVSQRLVQPDRDDVGISSPAKSKLLIVPHTKYFLPKIVLRLSDLDVEDEFDVATLRPDGVVDYPILENNKSASTKSSSSSPQIQEAVAIEWIRLLDADVPNGDSRVVA